MGLNWPSSGEYNVAAYQMSAMPYVTSSVINVGEIHRYEFPYVTRFVGVHNRGTALSDAIAVGFTDNGIKATVGNFITLDKGDNIDKEIRTTVLLVSCSSGTNVSYQLLCGLTNIPSRNFLPLSSSNGHPNVG